MIEKVNMIEKVHDGYYGLILILKDPRLLLGANLNFTHDAVQDMRVECQKATF